METCCRSPTTCSCRSPNPDSITIGRQMGACIVCTPADADLQGWEKLKSDTKWQKMVGNGGSEELPMSAKYLWKYRHDFCFQHCFYFAVFWCAAKTGPEDRIKQWLGTSWHGLLSAECASDVLLSVHISSRVFFISPIYMHSNISNF